MLLLHTEILIKKKGTWLDYENDKAYETKEKKTALDKRNPFF